MRPGPRWLVGLGGALAVAAVGVAWAIWTSRPGTGDGGIAGAFIEDQARLALQEALGDELEIAGFELAHDPLRAILTGVRFADAASDFSFTAARMEVAPIVDQAFSRVERIDGVVVEGLALVVALDDQGRLRLPGRGAGERASLPQITALTATDAKVEVRAAAGSLTAQGVALTYTHAEGGRLEAEANRATLASGDRTLALSALRAGMRVRDGRLELDTRLELGEPGADTQAGQARAHGAQLHASQRAGEWSASMRFEDLSATALLTMLGLPVVPAGRARLAGSASLTGRLVPLAMTGRVTAEVGEPLTPAPAWFKPDRVRYDGAIELADDRFSLEGPLQLGASEWTLRCHVARATPERRAELIASCDDCALDALLDGPAGGHGPMRLSWTRGATTDELKYTATLQGARFGDVSAERLVASLTRTRDVTTVALEGERLRTARDGGPRFDSASLAGQLEPGTAGLRVDQLTLKKGETRLALQGALGPGETMDLRWDEGELPVDLIATLLPELPERLRSLRGLVSGRARLQGPFSAPELTAELTAERLDLTEYLQGAFGQRSDPKASAGLRGHASGRLSLAWQGKTRKLGLTISELQIEQGATRVKNLDPIRASLHNGSLQVEPARLSAPHTRLVLASRATTPGAPPSLTLTGETDLSLLSDRLADMAHAHGTITSSMRIEGGLSAPRLVGELVLSDGTAEVFGQALSGIGARLSLRGRSLSLDQASAEWHAGTLSADGRMTLAGLSLSDFDLHVQGVDQQLAPAPGMAIALAADLHLESGPGGRAAALPRLRGQLTIERGSYRNRLPLMGLSVLVQKGFGSHPKRAAGDARFVLDIDLVQREPIVLRNNLFDSHLQMADQKPLHLGGTDEAPQLSGQLQLLGRLRLHSTDFAIDHAHIDFDGHHGLAPDVDMAAFTRRGLTLRMQGDPYAFELAVGCRSRRQDVTRAQDDDVRCRSVQGTMRCGDSLEELLQRFACNR